MFKSSSGVLKDVPMTKHDENTQKDSDGRGGPYEENSRVSTCVLCSW